MRFGTIPRIAAVVACIVAWSPGISRASEARVEERRFWSEIMQMDVPVRVVLPDGYLPDNEYASIYFLHGGVYEGFYENWADPNVKELLRNEQIVGIVPAIGSPWLDPFEHPDREIAWDVREGLPGWPPGVFSPYAGSVTVGGYSASIQVRKYASHFTDELIPFIENNYAVRHDRGGRGISGTSGGAVGSSNLVLHRPDLFSFAAFSSGTYECGNVGRRLRDLRTMDPEAFADSVAQQIESVAAGKYTIANRYLRLSEGGCGVLVASHYGGNVVTDEIFLRSVDVTELSDPTLLGDIVHIEFSSGDGAGDPENGVIEGASRESSLNYDAYLDEFGVRHRYIYMPGFGHSGGYFNVFWSDYWLEAARDVFANPMPVERWNYKTIDRDFEVWGYRFRVKRGNTEFLTLLDVGIDGFTARGTGGLTVETPPLYPPNALYRVETTAPDASTSVQAVRADAEGRIGPFTIQLGGARAFDQHSLLEEAGLFPFEDYVVSIVADPNAAGDEAATCDGRWIYPVLPCR